MENINDYSKKQADMCIDNDSIPKALYTDYGVKKGLRDENGQGVLTGLTNISSVRAFDVIDGVCLVEWGKLIDELFPDNTTYISISKDLSKGFDYRKVEVATKEMED